MSNLITIASREIGTKEIPGPKHNPRIVNYAKEAGFTFINDDETPWCSVFMNWVAKKALLETTDKANARSWLTVGLPITSPEPGDIVIFWRESLQSYKGHVGIFMGYSQDQSRIYTLGGNQSNQVSKTAYPAHQLLGFRRLRPVKKFILTNTILQKGSVGDDVVLLQDALKLLGFRPGTSDGIYGSRTEAAVKLFQSTNNGLAINGIFDGPTRKLMTEQLNRF